MPVTLTYTYIDDQGGNYLSVWGDGTFIYVACGADGLRSYSAGAVGNLTYIDTDNQGGSYNSVWGDGTYIYAACGTDGLRTYSVDAAGALTYIDTDDQGGSYNSVWGDGTYIYVACEGDGLRSYSVDGSGALTHIDTDDVGGGAYRAVWGDGTYIYVACATSGLRSYSVDGSGALTYIDTDDQGGAYRAVWGDGTYIYVACESGGLRSYSVDGSGALTHIDTDDQGDTYYSVWGDGTYIYAACYSSGLRSYSVDGSGNLTYTDADDQGDMYLSVWGDGTYIYVGTVTTGLLSYGVVATPSDKRYTKNLVTFCNNKVFYGPDPDNLAELAAASGDIDCSKPLAACEAYGQVFIANYDTFRVADFVNVKIVTTDVGSNIPHHGDIVTGGTSSASMVVAYITASSSACTIYGNRITARTFESGETVTGTNSDGDSVSFAISADEVAGPHWYTWTPYANDTTNFGTMPTYSSAVELHIGRVTLSADAQYPHQWYMARQNNPFDFLYAQNDAGSAVAGNNTDAGEVGDLVVDILSYSDDYMVCGCVSELHIMLGNPCAGGRINLFRNAGLLAPKAWTWDADGNLYMISTEGILRIPKGFGSAENITQANYPDFIEDLAYNADTDRVVVAYDHANKGIVISKTIVSSGVASWWFLDLRSGGFFPESYPTTCAAYSVLDFGADDPDDSGLLFGCSDGYVKCMDKSEKSDDGDVAIDAYIGFGPMATSDKTRKSNRISGIDIVTGGDGDGGGGDSSDVYCEVYTSPNAQKVITDMVAGTSPKYTKTHKSPGQRKGNVDRRKVFGRWVGVVVGNDTAGESFAFEHMNINGI